MPEQVAHLFEGRLRCQFVNVEATVGQHAPIAVDVADGGGGGDGIFEACLRLGVRCAHDAGSYQRRAPGPARGFLPIGPLADGTYQFTLRLNPVLTNHGTLTVQNGHYVLDIPEEQGVDFQNQDLK